MKHDKLVRDRIPELIKESGEEPVVHCADDEEYEERLYDKLEEEVQELQEDRDVEELIDIAEVIDALIKYHKIPPDEFQRLKEKKAKDSGSFDDRIVLEEVKE